MSEEKGMYGLPSVEQIEAAAKAIHPVFLNSPQFELEALNEWLEYRLVCKVETLNPIRSFKGRSTDWLVGQLKTKDRIICASAGNFGQGMAYACRIREIPLSIFAAEVANPLKLERMKQFAAEVILQGHDFDAAKEAARTYARTQQLRFVEDGRDVETAEGAGTIGLELLRYPESFDALLIPLGNGALINGIGTYFKAKSPTTKIIGVVAEKAPAMALSWRSAKVQTTERADTIADGIGVRIPVPEALEAMKQTVDDIVAVSEEALLEAMRLAHRLVGVVLEPSGAAGLAAAMAFRQRFKGQQLATLFCGGNLTEEQMTRWL